VTADDNSTGSSGCVLYDAFTLQRTVDQSISVVLKIRILRYRGGYPSSLKLTSLVVLTSVYIELRRLCSILPRTESDRGW
jgi:hypothetical protein